MKLSASMLRVLRACAAGEVTLTRAPRLPEWWLVWRDGDGRNVDRQVSALRWHGLLTHNGVALSDAGRKALAESEALARESRR